MTRKDSNQCAVSAKARQLNHRLKNRKAAIVSRREAERAETTAKDDDLRSPPSRPNGDQKTPGSPASGFVAVNSKPQPVEPSPFQLDSSAQDNARNPSASLVNGYSSQGASAATRAELLSKFHTSSERASSVSEPDRRGSNASVRPSLPPKSKSRASGDQLDYPGFLLNAAGASAVPIPNTPSSLLPYVKPSAADRFDDSGPYKGDMMLRMEQLNRGDRVQPPCDRCRRLHMDCLKNLTACMGCTRKHAKCSWKDVEAQELRDHPFVPRVVLEAGERGSGDEDWKGKETGSEKMKKNWSREVRDEELLGEDDSDEGDPAGEDGHLPQTARRFDAKSHSPSAGTAATGTTGDRNGTSSAPATTSQTSPTLQPPAHAHPEGASNRVSHASTAPKGHPHPKPEIPLYRPPEAQMRSFTAHEWDTHTRSPTTTTTTTHNNASTNPKRATPSSEARSDIHDELKSAALEAEKDFERRSHEAERADHSGGRVSDPAATSASPRITKHERETLPAADKKSPKLQPTPPPEEDSGRRELPLAGRKKFGLEDQVPLRRDVEMVVEDSLSPAPVPAPATELSADIDMEMDVETGGQKPVSDHTPRPTAGTQASIQA